MRPTLLLKAILLMCVFQSVANAQTSLSTTSDAAAYLMGTGVISETATIRVAEFAERMTPGIHRWSITFLDNNSMKAVAIDSEGASNIISEFDEVSFYSEAFYDVLPSPRNLPDAGPFVEKAAELLKAEFPDHALGQGHILRYNYCIPPTAGEASDYANGCQRDEPLHKWRVYMQVTPPGQDWVVKEVTFGDNTVPVIKSGPRGYFQ